MKPSARGCLDELILRFPALEGCRAALVSALDMLIDCYRGGGKLLVCGNGGSASDALHIVGELMKDFAIPRPLSADVRSRLSARSERGAYMAEHLQEALPAVALVGSVALESAYANDRAPDLAFAQQVYGLGAAGDVLLGISTSGNSRNVLYAAEAAAVKGMRTIGLTGAAGGKMKEVFDLVIAVPETETYRVQELHLPVYHAICLALENEFFGA